MSAPTPPIHHPSLLEVNLPISLSLGRTRLALKDILGMQVGSRIPLDGAADSRVEILANNAVIGWGEIVNVDGYYGVRIERLVK